MSMTKEELVYDFANRQFHKAPINTARDLMCVCSDFANEFLAQPLAQRLTTEEKERVKGNYADAKDIHSRCIGTMSKNHIADLHNEYNKGLNMGIMIALKYLFGSDFFKEGE